MKMRHWLANLFRGRTTPMLLPGTATFSVVTKSPGSWPSDRARVTIVSAPDAARSEFAVFHTPCFTPTPEALHHLAAAIVQHPNADFLFGDEMTPAGPWHKPGWSSALLLAQPYVVNLFAVRTELLAGTLSRVAAPTLDLYELALLATAKARSVVHVPHVLGSTSQPHGLTEGHATAALVAANAAGLQATITRHPDAPVLRVSVRPRRPQAITILVPTRDRIDLMRTCIDSVLPTIGRRDVRILIVDNGSIEPATLAQFAAWCRDPRITVLRDDAPFDYSALMNKAVAACQTPLVLLLNNDTQVISPHWLDELAGWLDLPGVGAVGAKLYHGDDTVQHAGVLVGVGGVASHGHKNFARSHPGYHGLLHSVRDVSAVTGACLLTRRDLWLEVGGMDPELRVAYNDVDFCLKLRARGHRIVWTPLAEIYHFEGKSRGKDKRGQTRFEREIASFQERWQHVIAADPFYNPNLSVRHVDYRLR